MDTVAVFNQILLGIAIPILTAAAVGVARQAWSWFKSKIPANRLYALQMAVKTVVDAARQSGLVNELSAAEKAVENVLVADAQAFCDAHHIPIGSVAALAQLIRAELLKDLTPPAPSPVPREGGTAAAGGGGSILAPPDHVVGDGGKG